MFYTLVTTCGMRSDSADPGLFDTPLPQPAPPSHGDISSGNRQNTRRVYRPVSEEKRKSREYRVSRERNNRAVQRCRANNKVKQDCLVIKSEGYRALAEEYIKAAHELETDRKQLEELFRLCMATGQQTRHLQALLGTESVTRTGFEERVEVIRQRYARRVQAMTEGHQTDIPTAISPLSSASPPSSLFSHSSLRPMELQPGLPSSPFS
ncbi:expressed conserved protein [Echinococcus multilocularis]|uniref:Expressed conserved protein n=1 Tax=Echinococcus multilocularis TaxID=6211 RepID=A0A068YFF5_ECHMU|nr:expressed conserved protein [Echinococcus multilocularis]